MRLGPLVALSLRRIARRPVRSFLLLQGTIWGVAVAVFPSAVIGGTRQAAIERAEALGADRFTLTADPTASLDRGLAREDAEAVRAGLREAGIPPRAVAGLVVLSLLPAPEGLPGALVAASGEVGAARGLEIEEGRWIEPDDPPGACVVEAGVAALLGRERLVPGDRIRPDPAGEERVVVGVTRPRPEESRRANDMGFDLEHPMFRNVTRGLLWSLGVPLVADEWKRSDRVVYIAPRDERLDWIYARVDTREVSRATKVATDLLAARGKPSLALHGVTFQILLGGQIDRFLAVDAALFLACLVMGAVVVANMGLLTVLRRSREIAIRRVEGATRLDLALQFLVEGFVLAVVGCGLGLLLGMGLAEFRSSLEPVAGMTWRFPTEAAVVACAVALVVGVLALWAPAVRASRLDPIEGLVDE